MNDNLQDDSIPDDQTQLSDTTKVGGSQYGTKPLPSSKPVTGGTDYYRGETPDLEDKTRLNTHQSRPSMSKNPVIPNQAEDISTDNKPARSSRMDILKRQREAMLGGPGHSNNLTESKKTDRPIDPDDRANSSLFDQTLSSPILATDSGGRSPVETPPTTQDTEETDLRRTGGNHSKPHSGYQASEDPLITGVYQDQPRQETDKILKTTVSRETEFSIPRGHQPGSAEGKPTTTTSTTMTSNDFARIFHTITENVGRAVVGKDETVSLCVTALIAGGHVLLEDNPGTGKTQLARALSRSIDVEFKRIQFTPDLLPSDVVGVTFYDQAKGQFSFRPGPVFASMILADEINRASPKTQSALLEVMEEEKVTVDGITYQTPHPFMVLATQNPIEHLGTYSLPEAQMDRFLIRTSIGAPGHEASLRILQEADIRDRASLVSPVVSAREIDSMARCASGLYCAPSILEYIIRIIEATRHSKSIKVGSSIRGGLALVRCARIRACSQARDYVIPDDVKDLVDPVLAHRLVLETETRLSGINEHQALAEALVTVPVPEAEH